MPVPRPLILAALVAVMAVMAARAPAARADWSAPVTVSAPHSSIGLQLGSGPAGDWLAWQYVDLIVAKGIFGPPGVRYAVAPPGGSFGPERPLPSSFARGQLVDLGGGRVAALTFGPGYAPSVSVTLGRVGAGFGAPQRIRSSVVGSSVSLAGNASGELLLAWVGFPPGLSSKEYDISHEQIWVSVRPRGGRFGAPHRLAPGNDISVTTAVGAQGDMVVAFDTIQGRMLARVRRHGRSWGPIQDIGRAAEGTYDKLTTYVGRNGRVIVAWYDEHVEPYGGPLGPAYTRVAVQLPGAHRFRRAQVLARDTTPIIELDASSAPKVIAVGDHAPMVIFLARGATLPARESLGSAVVEVAYAKGSGFAAPQGLSPADEHASDVAVAAGPNGAIVTWIRDEPSGYTGTVLATARQPATGLFGPPEQVSPSEHVLSALSTFNTASRWPKNSIVPWMVAWTSRPLSEASTVVRVSSPLCPSEPLGSLVLPATTPDPACFGA